MALITDASLNGVGLQLRNKGDDGKLKIVACASASLSSSELHNPYFEKETLHLIFVVRKIHKYLYDRLLPF